MANQLNGGLQTRVLRVTLALPGGNVVIDQTAHMRIRIKKAALCLQNKAEIEITNLTVQIRQQLLSNFTAWQRNQRDEFGAPANYVGVTIEAGYIAPNGSDTTSIVYKGEVVQCDLITPPPNVTIQICCFTHQIDKTKYISSPASDTQTFKEMVVWAGQQMGFDQQHIICNTSYDNTIVNNIARSVYVAAGLLPYIQDYYHPDVAAFIDDDFLIVKDRDKAINPSDIVSLIEFVGMPNWTEWGAEGVVLLDPSIRLAGAANFQSQLNPSLNGQYVIMELEYELTSRDTPFYVKVSGTPPGG